MELVPETEIIVDELLYIIRSMSFCRGSPFIFDEQAKRFKIRKDKWFVRTRIFLFTWNLWALGWKTYWWNYGRIHNDHSVTEGMLDNLYVLAMVMCVLLHVRLALTQDSFLAFINSLLRLNNYLDEKFPEVESRKRNKFKNWRWWLTIYVIFLTWSHSAAAGIIMFRNPSNRRYTYNAIYLVTADSWIKYLNVIFHWIRLMHHWGVLGLYICVGSFYYQLSKYWVKRTRFDSTMHIINGQHLNIYRSFQYLNNFYNSVFGTTNAIMFFCIWINLLYYCVMIIIGLGVIPFPEYCAFPLVGIGGTGFILVMIDEMVGVLTSSEAYIEGLANVTSGRRKCKSSLMQRRLWVNMAGFFHVAEYAVLLFVAALVDYVVNILLTVG